MKAKNMAIKAVILLGTLLTSAFLATNLLIGNSSREGDISARGTIFLARPVFAEGMDTSFLEEEAGISAYTNVGQAIDLEAARSAFRTIEYETDEYIVGSVPLPDYAETEDVHVFVHRDGWVVSYYLRDEPTGKIVDWEEYSGGAITGTKLEDGIFAVCAATGVPAGDTEYYHFRYAYANELVIVAEAVSGEEDTFRMKLPGNFIFYERSYSHSHYYSSSFYSSCMCIDGEPISDARAETKYGLVSPSQLSADVFHTVKISKSGGTAFGAIVLIYQEP